jgi:hypothetical protein
MHRWLIAFITVPSFLVGASSLSGQEVRAGGTEAITIRGILSGTMFLQDATFGPGNGQQAQFVRDELAGWWHGGDVRNMRLTLNFAGPRFSDSWDVGGTFEIDFFGGFSGAPNFSDEQPLPRLRLAFADLTSGRTRLRIGQDWSLTLGNIPVSTSHIGFPLGWGSGGFIGWRFPGIWFSQQLTPADARTTARLQLAVMRGSWEDEPAGDGPSGGEVGLPQFEARLDLGGGGSPATWGVYLVGHVDQKDLNGFRLEGEPELPDNDLTGWAFEGGANLISGALTLSGNAYVGRAMGHQFAHLIQFGDIGGWGAWGQAGLNLSPDWSIWAFLGTDDADDEDVVAAGDDLLGSVLLVPMLRFKRGPYALGFEWLHNRTDYGEPDTRRGNQLLFSVRYDF